MTTYQFLHTHEYIDKINKAKKGKRVPGGHGNIDFCPVLYMCKGNLIFSLLCMRKK